MKILSPLLACKAALVVLLATSTSTQAMVGGQPVPQGLEGRDHPGQFNTVAFVAFAGNYSRVFCTGSIIASDLILTAKHCVAGRDQKSIKVYFGPDTDHLQPSLLREVSRIEVAGSSDWTSYFPNLDIAVVQFAGALPNQDGADPNLPRFRPLEILRNREALAPRQPLRLAGFGNRATSLTEVVAGQLFFIDVELKEYLLSTFFQNLLFIQAQPGQGACHGDSGGPAYFPVPSSPPGGPTTWAIAGVTNGFDVALTPRALQKTPDPLFPLKANCDQGEILYGFAGHYVDWIEQTFERRLPQSSWNPTPPPPPRLGHSPKRRFKDWCQDTALDEPGWLTARTLVLEAIKRKAPHESERDLFLNCERVEELLGGITELAFNAESDLDSLAPLTTLPRLKSLQLSERQDLEKLGLPLLLTAPQLESLSLIRSPLKKPEDLKPLADRLASLKLNHVGLSDLEFIRNFRQLRRLDISSNPLSDLSPLRGLTQLEGLMVSAAKLTEAAVVSELGRLKELDLSYNQLAQLPSLKALRQLQNLNVSNNQLDSLAFLAGGRWPSLQELAINKNPLRHSLGVLATFTELRVLDFGDTGIGKLGFLKGMRELVRLEANDNGITDVSVFAQTVHHFPHLERLILAGNQIQDFSPLGRPPQLQGLFANGNPLTEGQVKPTERNCPTRGVNLALQRVCAALRDGR